MRISYPCGAPGQCAPDRIRFVDTGAASDFGNGWTVGPNTDLHYAGYAQDRWSPNKNLTFTLGFRLDYQRVGYGDAVRKPLIQDVAPDGTRIFRPPRRSGPDAPRQHEHRARLGVTADVSGRGKVVLKGFYGRYYNNLADGFSAINPGGQSRADFNFVDRNGNGLDGPSGSARCAAARAPSSAGRRELQDAAHRGDQRARSNTNCPANRPHG
ncbi:MAG: hypothetical protein U0Q12_02865 [Vicinamibacterales bacterium]